MDLKFALSANYKILSHLLVVWSIVKSLLEAQESETQVEERSSWFDPSAFAPGHYTPRLIWLLDGVNPKPLNKLHSSTDGLKITELLAQSLL